MKTEESVINHDKAMVEVRLRQVKHDLDTVMYLLDSDYFHDMIGAILHRAIEQNYIALLQFKGRSVETYKDLNQLRKACAPYFVLDDCKQAALLDKVTKFSHNPLPSLGMSSDEKSIFSDANDFAYALFDRILQLVGLTHRDMLDFHIAD